MNSRNVQGFVISRKNIGEADRLLLIFTREEGKIKVVARGARKLKSKLACQIEPYCLGNFYIVEGKTFNILTGAETKSCFETLSSNLDIYQKLTSFSQVLDALMPESVAHSIFYDKLETCLPYLINHNGKESRLAQEFLIYHLIKEAGFLPDINKCYKCNSVLKIQDTYFLDKNGPGCIVCHDKGNVTFENYKILKLIDNGDFEMIAKVKNVENLLFPVQNMLKLILEDVLPSKIKVIT